MGNIKVSQLQEQTTLNDNGYFYYVNGSDKSRKVSLQTMRTAFGGGGQALDITNAVSGVVDIPSFPSNGSNTGYICKQITNGTEPSNFVFSITDIGMSSGASQNRNYLVGVFAIVDSEGEDSYRNKVGITTEDTTQEAGKTYWKIASGRSLEQITGTAGTAITPGTMFDRAEPMILQSLFELRYNNVTGSEYTYVNEIDDPNVISTTLGGWWPFTNSPKVYGTNLNVHKNNSSVVWSKNTKLCIACWSSTNNWSSSTPTTKIKYLKTPVV